VQTTGSRADHLANTHAVRTDEALSITEIAGFFEAGQDRLFGTMAVPLGETSACVLISSPLFAEQARNYRREVILARELARRGIATFRYHYRGTGNSEGAATDLGFPSLCSDAAAALEHLRERCPGLPSASLGTRLGGFVAASVANDGSPLLLWDPIPDATPFFADAVKARQAGGMVTLREPSSTEPGDGGEDPWSGGFLDALGYRVPGVLKESLASVSFPSCLGSGARDVLVVTMVPRHEATPQAGVVAELIRDHTAAHVDLTRVDGRLTWWTSRDSWDPDEDHPPTREVIDRSADWLERHLAKAAA